ARTRIRHQLLPQLAREWNPALTETLAHTADLSLAEEAYWQAEIDRLAERHPNRPPPPAPPPPPPHAPPIPPPAPAPPAPPPAAARRLVRHAIHLAGGAPPSPD